MVMDYPKMKMKKSPICCHFMFRTERPKTTCAALLSHHPIPNGNSRSNTTPHNPTSFDDHKSLCLSLTERLIRRGLFSSAHEIIRRMIKHSCSASDAIWVFDFAAARGLEPDVGTYGALIKKLVASGMPQLAYGFYANGLIARGFNPDPFVLNSMVICSCMLGKLEEATTLFDRILSLNCVPSLEASDSILREFFARKRFSDAFDYFLGVFDVLRNRRLSWASVRVYRSLFYGLCKGGSVVEAELVLDEMRFRGLYVGETMYTFLVHEYCKGKKMNMAMRVFMRMLKTGCEPDRYICNTLIHGFMKLSLFDKGWAIHNKMIEWKIEPDVVTYHIMISEYCREEKIDCALMLLENMISSNLTPNVYCYTVLISALYKLNRLREIDELYKTMIERGVVPDHVLFLILMKNCPRGCELQLAFTILQGIAMNGCGFSYYMMPASSSLNPTHHLKQEIELLLDRIVRSNLSLANVAYGIFIAALCEQGKIGESLLCLDKILDLGCRPLHFTYNSIIKCLCRLGLFEDANSVIDLMQGDGMVPDQATYLVMITELCKEGDLISVSVILDQMKERGMKPIVAIYNSVIDCLCREKRVSEAEDMFKRMIQSGGDPDEAVYMTMIKGYSMNGRAIEACRLFDKMIENSIRPCSRCYTALISGLIKRDMTDMGCLYLGRMLEDGMSPNVMLYTSFIKHFLKNGEFGFAFRLVDFMEKNQMESDLIMCITLASGICRYITGTENKNHIFRKQSERAKEMLFYLLHQKYFLPRENNLIQSANSPEEMTSFAMKLIHKIKGVSFMPNLYLYNCIISGFCRAERIQDAYNHFELMQKDGIPPNQVTYTILIDGHIRSGDNDTAVRLFNRMNVDGCAPDRIAYNTLLKGFVKAGRPLTAVSLVYAMRKRGLYPDRVSYDKLLYCFCSSGLSLYGFRIFEEMIAKNYKPCLDNHKWLFHILYASNRLYEAHKVLDMMLQRVRTMNNFEKKPLMCVQG